MKLNESNVFLHVYEHEGDPQPPTMGGEFFRTAIAYAAADAVARARGRKIIDRDLDTNVPKRVREIALSVAVQLGYLVETEWRGQKAWVRK